MTTFAALQRDFPDWFWFVAAAGVVGLGLALAYLDRGRNKGDHS